MSMQETTTDAGAADPGLLKELRARREPAIGYEAGPTAYIYATDEPDDLSQRAAAEIERLAGLHAQAEARNQRLIDRIADLAIAEIVFPARPAPGQDPEANRNLTRLKQALRALVQEAHDQTSDAHEQPRHPALRP